MNNDDMANREERLISEFMGMCASFNVDNCSIDVLMEELSNDHTKNQKEESYKVIRKTYPN